MIAWKIKLNFSFVPSWRAKELFWNNVISLKIFSQSDAKTFPQKTIIPFRMGEYVWTWGAQPCWPSALVEIFLWVSNKGPNTNQEASLNQRWPLDLPLGGAERVGVQTGPAAAPRTWWLHQMRSRARRKADCSSRGWMWPPASLHTHRHRPGRVVGPRRDASVCVCMCVRVWACF